MSQFKAYLGQMLIKTKKQKGFTLIEILIVISIMAILATMSISSFSNSTDIIKFDNLTNSIAALFREARSLSLTGEATADYTDFDEDKIFYPANGVCGGAGPTACPNQPTNDCTCSTDEKVLAAGYGINFSKTIAKSSTSKIEFFTDLHNSSEGYFSSTNDGYNKSQDLIDSMKSINLGSSAEYKNYDFMINDGGNNNATIIYTTPYGDIIFPNTNVKQDLLIWVYEVNKGCVIKGVAEGNVIAINKVAGIPEVIKAGKLTHAQINSFNTTACTKK